MIIFWQIVFWLSVFSILYSYVFFPMILSVISKKNDFKKYDFDDNLPGISILMSIYNEEIVIKDKIDSILASNYPDDKIEIIIGSDCSDDKSNSIVESYTKKYDFIKFFPFTQRQGKPKVINQIYNHSNGKILVLTDANVMFDRNTLFELVKYFKDERIGLVDTQMIN